MIYELRIYTAVPGRLPDVLARFRDHTVGIWNRLGIRQLGYWTTAIGPDRGVIVADPEWIEVRKASEAAGPIVARMDNSFLAPTSFSPAR